MKNHIAVAVQLQNKINDKRKTEQLIHKICLPPESIKIRNYRMN